MWKKIAAGLAVLLILLGGAGYYLLSHLDSFVKSAIETYGTQATLTPVKVGSVSLSLTKGTGEITGLTVANPPGYSSAPAFSLGQIALALDTASLPGKGPVIINQLRIEKPQISYEVQGIAEGSNLQTIQSNLHRFTGSAAATQAPAGNGKPARKEVIRDLTISGGQVTVIAPAVLKKPLLVQLPDVHVTELGGPDGATPAQLGAQVADILLAKAAREGADAVVKQKLGVSGVGGILQGLLGP